MHPSHPNGEHSSIRCFKNFVICYISSYKISYANTIFDIIIFNKYIVINISIFFSLLLYRQDMYRKIPQFLPKIEHLCALYPLQILKVATLIAYATIFPTLHGPIRCSVNTLSTTVNKQNIPNVSRYIFTLGFPFLNNIKICPIIFKRF